MMNDLLGDVIQEMLEGELEEELGYYKYDYKKKRPKIAVMVTVRKRLPHRRVTYLSIFP